MACLVVLLAPTGVGEAMVVSTLARHSWTEFVELCALMECRRRREETLLAEWRLLESGVTVGVGHVGMVWTCTVIEIILFFRGGFVTFLAYYWSHPNSVL